MKFLKLILLLSVTLLLSVGCSVIPFKQTELTPVELCGSKMKSYEVRGANYKRTECYE